LIDAVVIHARDNVVTAVRDLAPGAVTTNDGTMTLMEPIRAGFKFARCLIPTGEYVIKYGEAIGRAKTTITPGRVVHVDKVADILPDVRGPKLPEVPKATPAPPVLDPAALRRQTFAGYPRAEGRPGIRNLVLVVASVGCANHVVERISAETGATAITHQQGCLQLGDDLALTMKQLVGAASHPNVGAVLAVGLGCETVPAQGLQAAAKGRPAGAITIQGEGGTSKAVRRGTALISEMQRETQRAQRRPFLLSHLVVGTKCGGSDAFSGLTANPATGAACDVLVDTGAAVLLSETPGLFGSEPHLAARMTRAEDRARLRQALDHVWDEGIRLGGRVSESELSPGNIAGGLTTLVEKSLGATIKAGSRPIQGFLDPSESIPGPGLWIMDTPGFDAITISTQATGGAQLILFTTGRGTPIGCALAPVVKICSNTETFRWMEENMDVDAGTMLSAGDNIGGVAVRIIKRILATANGEPTKAEQNGHREFALARLGARL